ncbi:MAG: starch synthase [Gammaproteobacteria bacterium]|jgi:starch synthase
MTQKHRVLMVAAENDALPGGKVGGIADVVRHVPMALADLGNEVAVVTPAYGFLHLLPGARLRAHTEVAFGPGHHELSTYEVPGRDHHSGVTHLVMEGHGLGTGASAGIYHNDAPERPFATDATKFSLFCAGVANAAVQGVFGGVDTLHLHDWHAALILLLVRCDPHFAKLANLRTVFSIHNLSLQGVRPLGGDPSSLDAWFPNLEYKKRDVVDPRWPTCINPMAIGIRLADAVHTVSPTYAKEILQPSEPGRPGGEGLEGELGNAAQDGRLHGILNGCHYPNPKAITGAVARLITGPIAPSATIEEAESAQARWQALHRQATNAVLGWAASDATLASEHYIAGERLRVSTNITPELILTSVGRLTSQKVRLLRERMPDGRTIIEHVLDRLGPTGRYVVLGGGDPEFERAFTQQSAADERLIFLRGYSEALANSVYANGDLFLMPSSFEPCGISQMLAMRSGQPCLVHAVGGLRDTVRHGVDGFWFEGGTAQEQAVNLLTSLDQALTLRSTEPRRWQDIQTAAATARFEWADAARHYATRLYDATRNAGLETRASA